MGASFDDDGHHGHHHHHGGWRRLAYVAFCLSIGALLVAYATGALRTVFGIDLALAIALIAGYPLIRHAVEDLLRGHLSSHLTVAIAAAAAVAVGEYFAAAEVMFIMLIGEGLEHWTVDRAKGAIAGFVGSLPSRARRLSDGEATEVAISEIEPGDLVQVRAGERIPVDGVVERGSSTVDQRLITGEPMPVPKQPGAEVWSGSVNEYGVLEIRTERTGRGTTVARIAQLIEDAQKRRAPIVREADRLARWFLPAVLVAAGLIWFFTGEILRTVAALIVACPCALVLATPAAMAAAIARLGREGALVKGGEVLEALAGADAVAFDKTGTLTLGRPTLERVIPAPGFEESTALRFAAAAERESEHLLGRAILEGARERELDLPGASGFELRPGAGVVARVGDPARLVQVGSIEMIAERVSEDDCLSWARQAVTDVGADGTTPVIVALDERVAGVLALRDPLRPDAARAVGELRDLGLDPVLMLTGDAEPTARSIARRAGIAHFEAELLPEEKVHRVRELRGRGKRVVMVGDGINDAPALASADVGIALGPGAADLSAEAAQVILFKDRLEDLPRLVEYGRKVLRRIRSSILGFAFGVNFAAVGLAAFGLLGPALAAVVHQAASLAVILNCVRLLWEGRALEEPKGLTGSRPWRWAAPLVSSVERAGRLLLERPRRSLGAAVHRLDHTFDDGLASFTAALPERLRRLRPHLLPALLALWAASGLVRVGPAEVAVVQRFGRHTATLEPGLHLRWPWPIETRARVEPARVRTVEIGLGNPNLAEDERPYEWNLDHRVGAGRDPGKDADEMTRLVLTGDENLVELSAVALYSISDPVRYLFSTADPERVIALTAERTLRTAVARHSLDDVLTEERAALEREWRALLSESLARYDIGVSLESSAIRDVHPPIEVVEAFREASSALEERQTRIDLAEAYERRLLPLARGEARAIRLAAEGDRAAKVLVARGLAERLATHSSALLSDPDLQRFRLHLDTLDRTLPGKRKLLTDATGGRRRFLFVDPGTLPAAGPGFELATPPPPAPLPGDPSGDFRRPDPEPDRPPSAAPTPEDPIPPGRDR